MSLNLYQENVFEIKNYIIFMYLDKENLEISVFFQ